MVSTSHRCDHRRHHRCHHRSAIRDHIAKTIIGRDVDDFKDPMIALNACIRRTPAPKAAGCWPCGIWHGRLYKIPVYKLMGGAKSIVTDITISVNDPEGDGACLAKNAIDRGLTAQKVKVGKSRKRILHA